jgi:P-type Cu+ transporter
VSIRVLVAVVLLLNGLAAPPASASHDPGGATPHHSTGLLLSPMIAALAMSLLSVSVVGNALRLRTS